MAVDKSSAPGRYEEAFLTTSFIYTPQVLDDFEALYRKKAGVSLPVRVLLGLLGAAGAVYFGYGLYAEGLSIARVGYLVVSSLMLLVACSFGRSGLADETCQKYRTHYLNRRVSFSFDAEGLEMKLSRQKNYARSKYKEIYSLLETERCLYFVTKGKAYYILDKEALGNDDTDRLRSHMEKQCKRSFLMCDLSDN